MRKTYTDQFKAGAINRLYEPRAMQNAFARELGMTSLQLKAWRLEIEVAGSMAVMHRQQADAAELDRLEKESKRVKLENAILNKASAFLPQGQRRHDGEA